MLEKIQEMLAEELNLPVSKVTADAKIVEDLGADSLDVVELLSRLEDEFSITIGEVRPGDCAAVIAMNRSLRKSVFVMQWGFHTNGKLLITARSETAAEKPTFQQSITERRCLIPVSAYFEWSHRNIKTEKYRFCVPDNKLFYLAGLYRFEKDPWHPVFTILTREASHAISHIHDRMPVIIPSDLKNDWLDRTLSAKELLQSAVTDIFAETTN